MPSCRVPAKAFHDVRAGTPRMPRTATSTTISRRRLENTWQKSAPPRLKSTTACTTTQHGPGCCLPSSSTAASLPTGGSSARDRRSSHKSYPDRDIMSLCHLGYGRRGGPREGTGRDEQPFFCHGRTVMLLSTAPTIQTAVRVNGETHQCIKRLGDGSAVPAYVTLCGIPMLPQDVKRGGAVTCHKCRSEAAHHVHHR